jgi:hypothetical protein
MEAVTGGEFDVYRPRARWQYGDRKPCDLTEMCLAF